MVIFLESPPEQSTPVANQRPKPAVNITSVSELSIGNSSNVSNTSQRSETARSRSMIRQDAIEIDEEPKPTTDRDLSRTIEDNTRQMTNMLEMLVRRIDTLEAKTKK